MLPSVGYPTHLLIGPVETKFLRFEEFDYNLPSSSEVSQAPHYSGIRIEV